MSKLVTVESVLTINTTPGENGASASKMHDFPLPEGWVVIPQELKEKAMELLPHVNLVFDKNGIVTDVTDNAESRAAAEEVKETFELEAQRAATQRESFERRVALLTDVVLEGGAESLSPELRARHTETLQELRAFKPVAAADKSPAREGKTPKKKETSR